MKRCSFVPLFLTTIIFSTAVQAGTSMVRSPQPGWNGWSVETKVKSGFRQHGGTAEDAVVDTAVRSITPGTDAGAVVSPRTVSVSRTPATGSAKDKAEGSLAFSYTVGNLTTQDAFTFTLNSITSAMTARHNFGAGLVPADAFFEAEVIVRTVAPVAVGAEIKLPALPALVSPRTETMTASFSGFAGGLPLGGFMLPGYDALTMPFNLDGVQMFEYRFNYSIVTPFGEDPEITYTLTGGAGGQSPANLVPNPGFEIAGPANPTITDEPEAADLASAAGWDQFRGVGPVTTQRLPSTNTLGGSAGQMLRLAGSGVLSNRPGISHRISAMLSEEVPPGTRGGVDVLVTAGLARIGFNDDQVDGDALLVGFVTVGPSPVWQHVTFSNVGQASQRLSVLIGGSSTTSFPAEVYLDNFTVHPPAPSRAARYDYTGKFGPQQKWISGFAYPNQIPATGDFDGDGLDDLITFLRSAYPTQTGQVYIARNTGGAFSAAELWQPYFCVDNEIPGVGDFDGDGRDDIITFVPDSGKVWVALSTGTGFTIGREWYPAGQSFALAGDIPVVGDVNGDRLDDIVSFAGNEIWVSLNTGRGFALQTRWQVDFRQGGGTPKLADVNGDGRADAVLFVQNSRTGTEAGDVEVALSNGTNAFTYGPFRAWHQNFAPVGPDYTPLMADLNGDGCSDILAVQQDGRTYAAIATGTESFASGNGSNTLDAGWQWHADVRNPGELPMVGAFNRDMNDDLCTFVFGQRSGADFAATYVTLCGNPDFPLLTSVSAVDLVTSSGFIMARGTGFPSADWADSARLVGPGNVIVTPIVQSSNLTTGLFRMPGGSWPTGLYRFMLFDSEAQVSSSNAFPVRAENPWQAWRRQHFAAWERGSAGFIEEQSDPDKDGLSNIEEFLFDTDPRRSSPSQVNWDLLDGRFLTILAPRADRAVRVAIESSTGLGTWTQDYTFTFPGNVPLGGIANSFFTTRVYPVRPAQLYARLRFSLAP